ncbi:MAG: hypothetical protein H6734_25100 [Alphaproteobacteria bacterium]|nr:hypothetical protein [Alphaproteobacteria bacterium]MCB9672774.1 hypothetical protein [Alphaproteobacteria bacterium]
MTRALGALLLALLPAVAGAACPEPRSNNDLVVALEDATAAFGKLEIDAFNKAAEEASAILVCLDEPISRPSAAEYHRVMGIQLFLSRNSPAAQKSFAAARSVEPDYTFPTDLVPEGNPIRDDYTAVDPQLGPMEMATNPKSGSIRLNGSRSLNRARPLPVIFQLLDGRGAVTQTVLVGPDTDLPSYELEGPATNEPRPPKEAGAGPSKPLLFGAVGAAVVAAGLYGGALATKGSFNGATDPSVLAGKQKTANSLVITSGVLGAVAVGSGTTAFLVSGRF